MKLKTTALAVAAATTLAAGSANASIYARSYLDISDLLISLDNSNVINTFTFTTSTSASLNGATPTADEDTCTGNVGSACQGTGAGGESAGNYRLNSDHAIQGGSSSENTFTILGPGSAEYAQADAVIWEAALSNPGGELTHIEQFAESELQGGTSASSRAGIESTTGFEFNFDVAEVTNMSFAFEAAWDYLAKFDDLTASDATAQSVMTVAFTLTNNDDDTEVRWRSSGSTSTGCSVDAPYSCTQTADAHDLNFTTSITTQGQEIGDSGTGSFAWTFEDLVAGNYSLSLEATTRAIVTRNPIPAPASLALLGLGLSVLGFTSRRRKQA